MFSLGSVEKNLGSHSLNTVRSRSNEGVVDPQSSPNKGMILKSLDSSSDDFWERCSPPSLAFSSFNNPNALFDKNNLVKKVEALNYKPVFERQSEIVDLAKSLLGTQSCKVCLQGPFFSGKKSIVYGLAQKISKNAVPLRLRNFEILDVCSLLSDTQKFNLSVVPNLIKNNTICLITDFEMYLTCSDERSFLTQEIDSLIKKPSIPVIIIQPSAERSKYTQYLGVFFWTVFVNDPDESQMLEILKIQAERVSKLSGCEFSDEVLNETQRLARIKQSSSVPLSLIRRCFLILDRIGSDFEFKVFENTEMPTLKISKKNVEEAEKELFQKMLEGSFPPYIS